MKLRNRFRRFLFYVFVYDALATFADFWYEIDKEEYRKFVTYALSHELWDNSKTVNDQDKATIYIVLSDYFGKKIHNDFDAKYRIWA